MSGFAVVFCVALVAYGSQMAFGMHEVINFDCAAGSHLSRLKSRFIPEASDREWMFECRSSGFVNNDCTWYGPANEPDEPLSFRCPNHGLITGVYSEYAPYYHDRTYYFKCCNVSKLQDSKNDLFLAK